MVARKIPCRPPGHSCRGFSLVELIIVMAIMIIAMGALVPSIKDFMSGQRVQSASFDLEATAMFARSEALKRGVPITIVGAGGDDLTQGWCVLFGTGTGADCDVNTEIPGSKVMRLQQPLSNVNFAFVEPASAAPITFNLAGRLSERVIIKVTDAVAADQVKVRCLMIDVSGSARIAVSKTGECS